MRPRCARLLRGLAHLIVLPSAGPEQLPCGVRAAALGAQPCYGEHRERRLLSPRRPRRYCRRRRRRRQQRRRRRRPQAASAAPAAPLAAPPPARSPAAALTAVRLAAAAAAALADVVPPALPHSSLPGGPPPHACTCASRCASRGRRAHRFFARHCCASGVTRVPMSTRAWCICRVRIPPIYLETPVSLVNGTLQEQTPSHRKGRTRGALTLWHCLYIGVQPSMELDSAAPKTSPRSHEMPPYMGGGAFALEVARSCEAQQLSRTQVFPCPSCHHI